MSRKRGVLGEMCNRTAAHSRHTGTETHNRALQVRRCATWVNYHFGNSSVLFFRSLVRTWQSLPAVSRTETIFLEDLGDAHGAGLGRSMGGTSSGNLILRSCWMQLSASRLRCRRGIVVRSPTTEGAASPQLFGKRTIPQRVSNMFALIFT